MLIEGSCHCRIVTYRVESDTPYPFSHCHCSICRKLAGGSGSAVNIMANRDSLEVKGAEHLKIYRSSLNDRGIYDTDGLGFSRRHFCKNCGSMMWNHNSRYPQWIYLFASSVDTPLPSPKEVRHTMVRHKASWTKIPEGEQKFEGYPEEGIEEWHKNRGLFGLT
jgi:hypothetical protein